MKRKNILDSSALLRFLQKEPGYEIVKEGLNNAQKENSYWLLNLINYGEICYIIKQRYGVEKWQEIFVLLEELPLIFYPTTKELILKAADIKVAYKLPYADAICAATAWLEEGNLFTSDQDFKKIEKYISITWV